MINQEIEEQIIINEEHMVTNEETKGQNFYTEE